MTFTRISKDIKRNMDYITEVTVSELLNLSCEYHDYGKINEEFQKRVKSKGRIKFDR